MRTREHEAERMALCKKWAKYPAKYFTDKIHLIMDNKKFDIPTSQTGKRFHKMKKVRFHLRTKSEGLKAGFTKPDTKKQRVNPGGRVDVCAAIVNGKVRMWHYLPKQNWCGKAAKDLYRGPVIKALKKHVGVKNQYIILEDNDPTVYKSNKGKKAKKDLKIRAIDYPRHSPDLHPLDFFVWSEVERRMALQKQPKNETAAQYKARLRHVALGIPEKVVRQAVLSIKKRAAMVVTAKGGDTKRD
jgi:hypothetical protein